MDLLPFYPLIGVGCYYSELHILIFRVNVEQVTFRNIGCVIHYRQVKMLYVCVLYRRVIYVPNACVIIFKHKNQKDNGLPIEQNISHYDKNGTSGVIC